MAPRGHLPRLVAGTLSVADLVALPPKELASARDRERHRAAREARLEEVRVRRRGPSE